MKKGYCTALDTVHKRASLGKTTASESREIHNTSDIGEASCINTVE